MNNDKHFLEDLVIVSCPRNNGEISQLIAEIVSRRAGKGGVNIIYGNSSSIPSQYSESAKKGLIKVFEISEARSPNGHKKPKKQTKKGEKKKYKIKERKL